MSESEHREREMPGGFPKPLEELLLRSKRQPLGISEPKSPGQLPESSSKHLAIEDGSRSGTPDPSGSHLQAPSVDLNTGNYSPATTSGSELPIIRDIQNDLKTILQRFFKEEEAKLEDQERQLKGLGDVYTNMFGIIFAKFKGSQLIASVEIMRRHKERSKIVADTLAEFQWEVDKQSFPSTDNIIDFWGDAIARWDRGGDEAINRELQMSVYKMYMDNAIDKLFHYINRMVRTRSPAPRSEGDEFSNALAGLVSAGSSYFLFEFSWKEVDWARILKVLDFIIAVKTLPAAIGKCFPKALGPGLENGS